MNRMILVLVALFIGSTSAAQAGLDKSQTQATVRDFNQSARAIRADFLSYPGYTLRIDDTDYTCLVPTALRRLALAGESFTVRKVHTKRDHFRVELQTPGKRKLEITVYDHGELSQLLLDRGLPRLLNDAFVYGADPAPVMYVGNRESGLVHHDRCNHLPPKALHQVFSSRDAAIAGGLRECPICFGSATNLPYANYLAYRTRGLEAAKAFELVYPASPDTAMQARLSLLGQIVLDGWPLELAGFDYDFRVVRAEPPLAASFATGIVIVSDTMLKAAEADEEILFVLAHEIAHCEMHLPPRAPFAGDRLFPSDKGYSVFVDWIVNQQLMADLVAVGWFQSQADGRWQLTRARAALAKVQQAVNEFDVPLSEFDADYSLYKRLRLFEPERYQPADLRRVFLGEDGEGDVRYEMRPLGFLVREKNFEPLFLLTTTDYQDKPAYGENCLGRFRVEGDQTVEFIPRTVAAIPGHTTLLVGQPTIGQRLTPAAIATLSSFEFHGLSGCKKWREEASR